MTLLGVIEAVSEEVAIERAVVLFNLDDERCKRLRSICAGSHHELPTALLAATRRLDGRSGPTP